MLTIVVASHGNYDEDMLVAGLQSQAPYVALIASKTRAHAILQYLREANLTEEQIARLKYPAGLDLGSITPEEIDLSILAEIIPRRQSLSTSPFSSPDLQSPQNIYPKNITEAKDPACGMMVEITGARFTSEYAETTYYFCSSGCKRAFDKEPQNIFDRNLPRCENPGVGTTTIFNED